MKIIQNLKNGRKMKLQIKKKIVLLGKNVLWILKKKKNLKM